MTTFTPGGNATSQLTLLEQRVQTELLVQIANTADNNSNQLRNDQAPALGVAVPVTSA